MPDAVALVLLALSLTLPWNLVQVGAQRIEVVLAVVVSAASLALPHLHARARLPPRWTTQRVRSVRVLAALPYGLCVVVTLVVDAVRGFADTSGHAGIGGSMALGLAGVLLAVAPVARRAVLAGVLALLLLTALASTVVALAQEVPFGSRSADARVVLVAAAVLVLAVPACGVLAADPSWRAAAVAVAGASVLAYLVGGWTSLGVLAPIESVHLAGFGLVLLAPLGAAAATTTGGPWWSGRGAADGHLPITAAACTAAVSAALWAVIALERLDELAAGVRDVATVVLAVVALVELLLALTVGSQLRRHLTGREHPDPLAGASAVAVGSVVLAVVALLVVAGDVGILLTQVDVFSLALPGAVLVLLLVPVGARSRVVVARASRYAPPPRPPGQALGRPPVPVPPPAPPRVPPPAPSVSFLPPPGLTPGQAADPSTPPALLAAMVEVAPELRPAVAANPAASEELIARLRSFGDPGVDAVLRARGLG